MMLLPQVFIFLTIIHSLGHFSNAPTILYYCYYFARERKEPLSAKVLFLLCVHGAIKSKCKTTPVRFVLDPHEKRNERESTDQT